MARLLPYLLAFGAGFFLCLIMVIRRSVPKPAVRIRAREAAGGDPGWEGKYREVSQRYRDLTQRLQDIDRASEAKASRLRKTLLSVGEILKLDGKVPAGRAAEALKEIDSALRDP